MEMTVESSAFRNGEMIPELHSCDGANLSPPLSWTGIPEQAQSLALICDDPDAPRGTWVHWVLYNIPADADGLPAGMRKEAVLENGARQGVNSSKGIGYDGPCPPSGSTHRYFFKVYALDAPLDLQGAVSKAQLENAMREHIVATGHLMGRYGR